MILANRSIRIGAGAIDLHLSGALDNRQGIAGSGGTLANRGTLRAPGTCRRQPRRCSTPG
ncbi:hypothetical protein CCZ27_20690 [Thauera sinica]|nr:hypothetical protein CCZ27_20690 [Thauera sp. K11]